MRYFYFCFLAIGMGLPAFAKTVACASAQGPSSSKGTKAVCLTPAPSADKPKQRTVATATQEVIRPQQQHPAGSPILGNRLVAYPSPASAAISGFAAGVERAAKDVTGTGRLARVTAYWAGEGDYYTGHGVSSTGVRLHDGHCAVDPNIIPYGSVVEIPGLGKFLAVDTGSAVISRTAAREGGHTSAERAAIVIDVYFESRREGEKFAAGMAKYTPIKWWTPTASSENRALARSLFAEEDWTRIQSKQL